MSQDLSEENKKLKTEIKELKAEIKELKNGVKSYQMDNAFREDMHENRRINDRELSFIIRTLGI